MPHKPGQLRAIALSFFISGAAIFTHMAPNEQTTSLDRWHHRRRIRPDLRTEPVGDRLDAWVPMPARD